MNISILEQSKKSKSLFKKILSKWKLILACLIIAALSYSGYSFFANSAKNNENQKQKEVYTVKKDDIKVSIETDGRVVAEDGVELSFSSTGTTIDEIYVKEGDFVYKGDKIAKIDTTYMEIDLASAVSGLEIAKANLAVKEAGATDSELALAKQSVQQAEANLAQIQKQNELDIQNAEVSLERAKDDLDNIDTEIEKTQLTINQALEDSILKVDSAILEVQASINDVKSIYEDETYDHFVNVLFGALDSQAVHSVELMLSKIQSAYEEHLENFDEVTLEDGEEIILENLDSALELIKSTEEILDTLIIALDNSINDTVFTATDLNSLRSSVESQNSQIRSKEESLINAQQTIATAKLEDPEETAQEQYDDAVLNLESVKVKAAASEEDAVLQLEQAKIQLEQKYEVLDSDLTSLKAQVDQAQYKIDKLLRDIELATLYAPIDGEIAQLNGKVDEYIVKDTTDAFVTILNKDTFYIEAYIEEMDITKIDVGQKIYATFDAIEDAELTGKVSYVSLTSTIDNSGIVTYLVRILLDDVGDVPIREGMTAFVEFITSETSDVLVVPVKAVTNYDGKPSVQMENGEWRAVTTGFTDGKMVEIISGLSAGDKIIY